PPRRNAPLLSPTLESGALPWSGSVRKRRSWKVSGPARDGRWRLRKDQPGSPDSWRVRESPNASSLLWCASELVSRSAKIARSFVLFQTETRRRANLKTGLCFLMERPFHESKLRAGFRSPLGFAAGDRAAPSATRRSQNRLRAHRSRHQSGRSQRRRLHGAAGADRPLFRRMGRNKPLGIRRRLSLEFRHRYGECRAFEGSLAALRPAIRRCALSSARRSLVLLGLHRLLLIGESPSSSSVVDG